MGSRPIPFWIVVGCLAGSAGAAPAPATSPTLTLELPDPPIRRPDAAAKSQACLECHPDIAEMFKSDAHVAPNFYCIVCHGESAGHVELKEEGTMPDRSWRRWKDDHWEWRVDKATLRIALFCASCHGRAPAPTSDTKTIDFGAYLNSGHGRGVHAGNPDAPACTDCHAPHGVSDKPWTAAEVVDQCASCHGDPKKMARAGLEAEVMEDFKADRHANMAAVAADEKRSCITCHAPHGRGKQEDRPLNPETKSPGLSASRSAPQFTGSSADD